MSHIGDWVANCKPDRVERISAASVYLLEIGPPRPNQMQTLEGLEADGVVGLYKVGKKSPPEALAGQQAYLQSSEFSPSPESLREFLGSLGPLRSR